MYTFDVERMFILHQNSGGIGKSIPSILDISSTLLGCRGWISQYLLCFGGARIPLSGNLTFGISLRSQEISRVSGMDFPIPPSFWWSTDTTFGKSLVSQEISRVSGMDLPPSFWWSTDTTFGKSLRSQEISRMLGMDFPISPSFWWSTDIPFTPSSTLSSHLQMKNTFDGGPGGPPHSTAQTYANDVDDIP